MTLRFSPLRHEHVREVLEIELRSFPEPWNRGMFEREIALPISRFHVASLENVLVGYGGYWQVEDEAHIVNLAVHPDYRCRGIGRQILRHLSDMAAFQGLRRILLEVRQSNLAAQRLYASSGFHIVGRRPRYYADEDAILMERACRSV